MSAPRPRSSFTRFASGIAHLAGKPVAFATAVALILARVVTGPLFGFSENLDEEELDRIRSRYERLAEEARGARDVRKSQARH